MNKRKGIILAAALLVAGLGALPALGQDQDIKADIEALKKGQQEILQQIQELKKMIQAQARPAAPSVNVKDVLFDLGNNPVRGSDSAKLTLIEFTDYQ